MMPRLPKASRACRAGTPTQAYLANLLFLVLLAGILAGWQCPHFYWHATYLQRMDLARTDRVVIFWVLGAGDLLLLMPALAIGAWGGWRGVMRG